MDDIYQSFINSMNPNIYGNNSNKSLYSRIFAGVGGFDTYSAIVPNLYQDSFGEGSFVGKGIYDLEIFDQVLSEAFPDNKIPFSIFLFDT